MTVVVLVVVVPGGGSDNASAEGDTSRIDEEFGDVEVYFCFSVCLFFFARFDGGRLAEVGRNEVFVRAIDGVGTIRSVVVDWWKRTRRSGGGDEGEGRSSHRGGVAGASAGESLI